MTTKILSILFKLDYYVCVDVCMHLNFILIYFCLLVIDSTAISEDLGQVEYILTDKTGTLTENKMIFKRCFVNGSFYGSENGDAVKGKI